VLGLMLSYLQGSRGYRVIGESQLVDETRSLRIEQASDWEISIPTRVVLLQKGEVKRSTETLLYADPDHQDLRIEWSEDRFVFLSGEQELGFYHPDQDRLHPSALLSLYPH